MIQPWVPCPSTDTGMYRKCVGRAAGGSTANSPLVPLVCMTEPVRYTTPFRTAHAGIPSPGSWLSPDTQPLIRVSWCQVTPVIVGPGAGAVAADALPLPAVTPSAAMAAAATSEPNARPVQRRPARLRRVNMRKRARAVARPPLAGGTNMILAFCAGGPRDGPLLAQF